MFAKVLSLLRIEAAKFERMKQHPKVWSTYRSDYGASLLLGCYSSNFIQEIFFKEEEYLCAVSRHLVRDFGSCQEPLLSRLRPLHKKETGYQDPRITNYRCCSENHQISPHPPSRGITKVWYLRSSRTSIRIESTNYSRSSNRGGVFPSWHRIARCTRKNPFKDLPGILNESPLNKRNRQRKDSPRYLFVEDLPWSNGSPSFRLKPGRQAVRRGPLDKAETPKTWNRQRCYKVHPYWTNNLKYVC